MAGFGWWALKLSALIAAVFALSQLLPDLLYPSMVLVSSRAFSEPWRLLTHIFMHASVTHLLSNLFILSLFGTILEARIGSRRFLLVFFLSGLASSAADILFYESTLGASGAIFGVVGCLAAFRPRTVVLAFGVPMYAIIAAAAWMLLDLAGTFYPGNIAHWSHLFGLAAGAAYGMYLRTLMPSEPRRVKKNHEEISDSELDEWERKYMFR